jgi:hypothetical protein
MRRGSRHPAGSLGLRLQSAGKLDWTEALLSSDDQATVRRERRFKIRESSAGIGWDGGRGPPLKRSRIAALTSAAYRKSTMAPSTARKGINALLSMPPFYSH